MAVIAIFCDGTWNQFEGAQQTHVARLAKACARTRSQKVLYFEGVGTGNGRTSRLGRWLDRAGGGLFGWGLNGNIKSAYLELCKIYQPGDKIMVFGFSRGAYTARSLVGMIRKCGILSDPSEENLNQAFSLYKMRGGKNAPDEPHIWAARHKLSPDYATSDLDAIRRSDHSFLVRITYLGVWDTVGALGIPRVIPAPFARWWNTRYEFHDTRLSRLVEQARHAVSIDEKRAPFAPSLWENLTPSEMDPGLNRGDQSATRAYQQMWFAGNHGIIGGSVAPKQLGAASLLWIWAGARQAGLALNHDSPVPDVLVDSVQNVPNLYKVNKVYGLVPWLLRWRSGPRAPFELHPTARLRAAVLPEYRPKPLSRILIGLFRPC